MRLRLATALLLAALVAGCGGDDEDNEGGGSQVLKDAVAKTEAAATARIAVDYKVLGPSSSAFSGEGVIDFANERDHLSLVLGGRTIELFTDHGDEFVRQGKTGRYSVYPPAQDSPVANNPADSLRYVGTDVIDVEETDQTDCYGGKLDFSRIFERVEKGREDEFPEEFRDLKAPVVVCVDGNGRLARYDVDLDAAGTRVEVHTRISDHGTAPSLEPLSAAERPR